MAEKCPKQSETAPIFDSFSVVEKEIKSTFENIKQRLMQELNARRDKLLADLNDIKMKYYKKEKLRLEHIPNLTKLRDKLKGQENKMATLKEHINLVEAELKQYQIPTPVPLLEMNWNLKELINQCKKIGTFQDTTLNQYKVMGVKVSKLVNQVNKPSGLIIKNRDTLYIADCWNGRIQVVNIRNDWEVIGEVGKGKLVWPHSVDVYDQVLYTSDYGLNAILKFKNDEFILSSKEGELNSPFGIIVDENEVYVADNGNNRIAVLSLDLQFIREFGKMLKTPRDVNINQNRVFVADNSDAQNVHIFSKAGDLLSSIISLGNKTETIFLCFDKFNNILISDGSANKIHIYTIEGQLIHSIPCVYQQQQQGSFGYVNIDVNYKPTGIEITNDNKIIVADCTHNTIRMCYY